MNKPDPTDIDYNPFIRIAHGRRLDDRHPDGNPRLVVDLDDDRSVTFLFTDEGLIIDAWDYSDDDDRHTYSQGTFSQTYEEIIDNLLK